MPRDNKKEITTLLKISKDGAIVVHDEVVDLEKKVDENTANIKDEIKETKEMIKDFGGVERLKGDTPKVGTDFEQPKDGETPTDEELLILIKPLIPQVKDGKTPTKEEILKLIKPLIPKVEDGETPTDKQLLDLIKPLIPEPKKGEDGKDVDESRIEEIESDVKKLGERLKKIPKGGGGRIITGRYVNTPMVDVFTGDASTKAFTLSKAPKSLDTVKGWGSDFPHILVNGSDGGFTIAGKVLTLNDIVDAPSLDARFVVEYYI